MLDRSKNCADIYPLHGVYVFQSIKDGEGIVLCEHDFSAAIEIHVASHGGWKGFLLQFHCYEPWKESAWKIESVEELIQLLEQSCASECSRSFNVSYCQELVSFLKLALERKFEVTIKFEWGRV
jgi:hypothetical protein